MASKRRPSRLNRDLQARLPLARDQVAALRRLGPFYQSGLLAVLSGLILLAYLLSGQWLLLTLAVIVEGAGVEALLRLHRNAVAFSSRERAFYLIVPVLFTLGAGVFFRYTASGWWQLLAAIFSAAVLAAVNYAEYESVELDGEHYHTLRLVLNLAAYLAAFSLYTALYNHELPLPLAALLIGLVSGLVGVEILRELDLRLEVLVLYAATLGFVLMQARWALYFISLSGVLGGVFILIIFHVASQLLLSYLWGRLDRRAALEAGLVGGAGTLMVIIGRVLTHA